MWMRIIFTAVVFTLAGFAGENPDATAHRTIMPPVLRGSEPNDSGVLTLPGAPVPEAPPAPQARREFTMPPLPPPMTAPQDPPPLPPSVAALPILASLTKLPKSINPTSIQNAPPPALLPAPKPIFPPDFERDSATYCQKRIGEWTQPDVYNLFGDPLRQRAAPSDRKKEDSGRILAFSDPTGRYHEIELDFAPDTGLLRSVFVYPWQMTWQECRRLWAGNVSSAQANKGRIFYSYLNRRLDVLVDPDGKVISLGLY